MNIGGARRRGANNGGRTRVATRASAAALMAQQENEAPIMNAKNAAKIIRRPFQNITNDLQQASHQGHEKEPPLKKRLVLEQDTNEDQEEDIIQFSADEDEDVISEEEELSVDEEDDDEDDLTSLDMELMENPQYPQEYINEIFNLYRNIEHERMPGHYLSSTGMTTDVRRILVDWMLELHLSLKLKPETVFLAVSIMDRFLASQKSGVRKSKLQLIGCGALLIASKYEDIFVPEFSDFVYITKHAYSKDDIASIESVMLNTLGFQISGPTVFHFAQRFLQAGISRVDWTSMQVDGGDNMETSELDEVLNFKIEVFHFMQLSTLTSSCLNFPPSLVAAASILVALCRMDKQWNDDLTKYTGYTRDDLKECACHIFTQYKRDKEARAEGSNGCPSAATRYYYKKKSTVAKQALQLIG